MRCPIRAQPKNFKRFPVAQRPCNGTPDLDNANELVAASTPDTELISDAAAMVAVQAVNKCVCIRTLKGDGL